MTRSPDGHEPDAPNRPDEQPTVPQEESAIDQILADSFPASDAPPWTLGVTATVSDTRQERDRRRR